MKRLKTFSTVATTALAFTFVAGILRPSTAQALGFGCAGVAGEVILLDTLYGTGTGAVIAGVLEGIRDEHENWGKRIATGAAVGAGLGLLIGGLEVGLRDCSDPSRVNHTKLDQPKPGWQMPRLVMGETAPGAGVNLTYLFR